MNILRSRVVSLLAVLLVFGVTGAFAQEHDQIVGAWNYGPVGCTTCLDGMFSIAAGGTVVGYDNTPITSPNVGTWQKINHSTFRMSTKNAVYNADGSVRAFIVITNGTVTISQDGKTFTFAGVVKVLNPDGSFRNSSPFALGAARF